MSTTEAPPDPSIFEVLNQHIARGRQIANRPDLAPGQVRMWTGIVRAQLRKTFGVDSRVFRSWPTPDAAVSHADARQTLVERLGRLEQLMAAVDTSAARVLALPELNRIFIGHGRSPLWRELKDFLQDRLALPWDEFNRESTAGIATTERLNQTLDEAAFALLVMTAEDEHADSSIHARENVVHEIGLFQGKLGMRRAIALVEDGCQVFSNIHGLAHIPFPKGRISASFEEIRRVLEREKIIATR